MNWTREQRRIIEMEEYNILVSAAAGSGKTAVLVERIISLVKDKNENLDSFLVVTFTNEAASGMKKKIQEALIKAIGEGNNTKHLRKQLNLLEKAHIATFHSFCLDVLRKNFHLIGIDPSLKIGDTEELDGIYRKSIEEALEIEYSNENDDFITLVEGFSSNRYDDELHELINNTYLFIQSFEQPYKWLDEGVEKLNVDGLDLMDSPWIKVLIDHSRLSLVGARRLVELGIGICQAEDGPNYYEGTLRKDLDLINQLINESFGEPGIFINSLSNHSFVRISKDKGVEKREVNPEKEDLIKNKNRTKYKDIVKDLSNLFSINSLDSYGKDLKHMYPSMKSLYRIVKNVDDIFSRKKKELSLLDFNDLESYALEVLTDPSSLDDKKEPRPSEIAMEYRDKIKYIFIDEYQDINGKQEAIINKIKREKNLFMVGDVKQSIYRFRLADPGIFNEKYNSFSFDREELDDDNIHRVIELNKNFRSREEILKSTNYIFSRIMSSEFGEIDYNEKVFLNTGNEEFTTNNPVELNIIDLDKNEIEKTHEPDEENREDNDDELKFLEKVELEARFTARRIKELLQEKTFHKESDDKLKRVAYGDIVILLRAVSGWAGIYEEVFRKEKIPFYYEGGGGYFNSIEVQVAVNVLKLLHNTAQDIPLLSVMRSPIGGFDIRELTLIRSIYRKGSYYNACRNYINGLEIDDKAAVIDEELRAKLKSFFNRLDHWRDESNNMKLEDLIWMILLDSKYYGFVGGLTKGKERQANLRMLVDKAYTYTSGTTRNIYDFLLYVETIMSRDNDKTGSAKVIGINEDVVRLMSIHNSKGLEYPIVFLNSLDRGFNKLDNSKKVLMHKELGIGPIYFDMDKRIRKSTLARDAIAKKNELEALAEEMRILYVGMTRAIDRLIMVGTIDDLMTKYNRWVQGTDNYFLYKAKSYLDWIGPCIFKDLEHEELIGRVTRWEYDNFIIRRESAHNLLNISIDTSRNSTREKLMGLLEMSDDNLYDEVDQRLKFKYQWMDSGAAPAKLPVTGLKYASLSKEGSRDLIPPLNDILDYTKDQEGFKDENLPLSGTEIGTLIHLVMENFQFTTKITAKSVTDQIKDFEIRGLITKRQSEFIHKNYIEKIVSFYNSNIGKRMLNSTSIKREVPFILKKKASELFEGISGDDSVSVHGIIDCYFEEEDGLVILDYKTDNLRGRRVDEIIAEYRLQLGTYKEAIERITKKNVKETYLYLFSVGKEVMVDK